MSGQKSPMSVKSQKKEVVDSLERQIAELEKSDPTSACQEEIKRLRHQIEAFHEEVSRGQDTWSRVLLARHPQRPFTLDFIDLLFEDFHELHGDRRFGDDHAMVGGLAYFEERAVVVLGHQKGRDTKQKLLRNFRYAQAGRFSKGASADATCRQIQEACRVSGGYPGSLSGYRR